ncbi:tetratricopeptide repeat protein [Pseudodesulfovibrio sp.]|nr:tetratricopeptide repeat protein [Pseudodesulfovibrio sp.]
MKKHDKQKAVYVVKDGPNDIDRKHKDLATKNVYLLKENEEAIHRYSDTVCDFVNEDGGLFLAISQDKKFYHNFRTSFYNELRIDQERIRLIPCSQRAMKEIRVYKEHKKVPLVFLENILDGRSTLPFLEELKNTFKDILVIVLMTDSDEKKIAQCVEAGADNFIAKPVSVNVLIEKIANTLVPPNDVGKKIREGKERLRKVEFALAYGIAREILEIKPGSPAGLIIMGDALKGLSKRKDALKMYRQAMANAPMYLEPLKKIVDFYKEEEQLEGVLRYLTKMDELSPLHVDRKVELGELYFRKGDIKTAARYFAEAAELTHCQKLPTCVQMAKDYAERIFEAKEVEAEQLLALCAQLSKRYKADMHWSVYSRLGMLLKRRKEWQEAITAYSEASIRAPMDASILFNLGMAYVEGNDYGQASQKFERAMEIDASLYKDNLDAAYIMGQVFIRANRTKNAKKVLQYIFTTNPKYKKVSSLLASLQ